MWTRSELHALLITQFLLLSACFENFDQKCKKIFETYILEPVQALRT